MHYSVSFFLILYSFIFPILSIAQEEVKEKPKYKNIFDKILNSKEDAFFFTPAISRSPDTRLNFSLESMYYFNSNKKDTTSTRVSHLSGFTDYSLNKQFKIGTSWMIFVNNDDYLTNGSIYFSAYPDVFYGLGNKTDSDNKESYAHNKLRIKANLLKLLKKNYYLGANIKFNRYFYSEIENAPIIQEINNVSNIENQMLGFGLDFILDERDNSFYSKKGKYLNISNTYFAPFSNEFIGFNQVNAIYNKYFDLKKNQVFAFQIKTDWNIGSEIPFFEMNTVGGGKMLRSYAANRYKYNNFAGVQAEYRFPIYKRIRGAVFSGFGEVFETTNEIQLNYLKYSYGGGLRFIINKSSMLQVRVDYGRGFDNNNAIYLGIGEAF